MSIKVIQVGVGGFGASWRHTLTSTPGVEVVALVDIDQKALRSAAQALSVAEDRCYLNTDTSRAEVEADVVIDSTPQLHHYDNAKQAFAIGKHLVVVKPMSDAWDTGVAMVKEARKRGLKMAVAQQLRFHPVILKIREIVQAGKLGHVGRIHVDMRFGRNGYGGSYAQPYPVLVQSAIHHFDYLRWVLGEDAAAVWADCWNPPWVSGAGKRCAHVNIEMMGGCRVSYRGLATMAGSTNWTCNWSIEGEKGLLTVVNDHLALNGKELPVAWEDGTDIHDLNLSVLNKIIFERFMDYIRGGDEPGFSGRNNLNSLEMVFGAIQSYESGQKYLIEHEESAES
jgi:predicted dehydrogenase